MWEKRKRKHHGHSFHQSLTTILCEFTVKIYLKKFPDFSFSGSFPIRTSVPICSWSFVEVSRYRHRFTWLIRDEHSDTRVAQVEQMETCAQWANSTSCDENNERRKHSYSAEESRSKLIRFGGKIAEYPRRTERQRVFSSSFRPSPPHLVADRIKNEWRLDIDLMTLFFRLQVQLMVFTDGFQRFRQRHRSQTIPT